MATLSPRECVQIASKVLCVIKDWPPNSWLIHQILAVENEDCSIFEKAATVIDIYVGGIVCGVRDMNGAGVPRNRCEVSHYCSLFFKTGIRDARIILDV